MLARATPQYIDKLFDFLPPDILVLAHQPDMEETKAADPSPESHAAAKTALSLPEKKAILETVLRSPHFHTNLAGLTDALRSGGLVTVAAALGVKVANGGSARSTGMPVTGDEGVELFVDGIRRTVQDEN